MPTVARSAMLIRSPVHAVFQAFVQPVRLKKFWLKTASGPLTEGAQVHWEFLVPGASEEVSVRRLVDNELILFEWSDGAPKDKDNVFEKDGVRIFVDPKSLVYLDGTELDFVKNMMGHGFKFNNPNAKGACGCGESVQF